MYNAFVVVVNYKLRQDWNLDKNSAGGANSRQTKHLSTLAKFLGLNLDFM
jgi:hypothetical protein